MPDDRHPLTEAFTGAAGRRGERTAPETPRAAADRYGWTARDVAQRFNVSERTARRWRQQDRIPERRREDWNREVRRERDTRTRKRIERRGLKGMRVSGNYVVNSKYKYKARPDAPVRLMPGNKIQGSTMRDFFEAVDGGRLDEAESMLNDALGEGYEISGGGALSWDDVDGLDFDIG
jgi:hypothetical protein